MTAAIFRRKYIVWCLLRKNETCAMTNLIKTYCDWLGNIRGNVHTERSISWEQIVHADYGIEKSIKTPWGKWFFLPRTIDIWCIACRRLSVFIAHFGVLILRSKHISYSAHTMIIAGCLSAYFSLYILIAFSRVGISVVWLKLMGLLSSIQQTKGAEQQVVRIESLDE